MQRSCNQNLRGVPKRSKRIATVVGYKQRWLDSTPAAETKEAAVKPAKRIELLKSLELDRNEEVVLDGRGLPKSVSVLLFMLSCEMDSDERYDLYEHIVIECQLAECPELE